MIADEIAELFEAEQLTVGVDLRWQFQVNVMPVPTGEGQSRSMAVVIFLAPAVIVGEWISDTFAADIGAMLQPENVHTATYKAVERLRATRSQMLNQGLGR